MTLWKDGKEYVRCPQNTLLYVVVWSLRDAQEYKRGSLERIEAEGIVRRAELRAVERAAARKSPRPSDTGNRVMVKKAKAGS